MPLIESATAASNVVPNPFTDAQSMNDAQHFVENLNYLDIMVSLTVAAALGALIAFHPKRQIEASGPINDKELKQTQILICVAGATLVALIRGSLELAFGLVGLGGLVRYRTAMRNPVDLSIIFILIGLGMSCGLQFYQFAITITGFIYVLLYILEFSGSAYKYIWTLRVDSTDPSRVEKEFKQAAKEFKFHILQMKTALRTGRFRCRFTSKGRFKSEDLTQIIRERCGKDIQYTRFDWELERE